ncbi:MAG: cytochrome P450 [Chloroflexi bacterium]|nr:cytochrome P450 [Chloroflexota bacterium]MDA1146010.1 cytochrome P450 [Chloroflexota bacterium]
MTTDVTQLSASEISLADDGIFRRNEAHELFKILRRDAPVHWTGPSASNGRGFWSLTKLDDVLSVSRQPELFISSRGITLAEPLEDEDSSLGTEGGGGAMAEAAHGASRYGMLITSDPPNHVKLRRLVNKGFTPRAVRAMEDHIRLLTTQILDEIAPRGACDFVADVAAPLPLAVICEMMGIEREHWNTMLSLTNQLLGSSDQEYQQDAGVDAEAGTREAAQAATQQSAMQMYGHFMGMVADRREHRRDDLVALLVDSEIEGEQLNDMDILLFCLLLVVAGNETTRNAISGGMHVLSEHPDQWQQLREHPELIDSAVEEILRWTSPVAHMARIATADTEIHGQAIAKGDRVVMWYPSVNRDEDHFPEPYRFDITRSPNDHLAFGIGEHFCLGAGFARLEIKVIFQELLKRFPDMHAVGEPERLNSNFIAGIKRLPVEYTPAS